MFSNNNKKYDFTGKVALVTGSSTGIGEEIAVQFAQYGARVTITGRDEENLAKIAKRITEVSNVEPLEIIGDLVYDDTLPTRLIQQTVDKFGRLDFLINNAGGSVPNGTLEDLTRSSLALRVCRSNGLNLNQDTIVRSKVNEVRSTKSNCEVNCLSRSNDED